MEQYVNDITLLKKHKDDNCIKYVTYLAIPNIRNEEVLEKRNPDVRKISEKKSEIYVLSGIDSQCRETRKSGIRSSLA